MTVDGATLGSSGEGPCREPGLRWPQVCGGPGLEWIAGSWSPDCLRNWSRRAEGPLSWVGGCRASRGWPPPRSPSGSEITRLFWDGGKALRFRRRVL